MARIPTYATLGPVAIVPPPGFPHDIIVSVAAGFVATVVAGVAAGVGAAVAAYLVDYYLRRKR